MTRKLLLSAVGDYQGYAQRLDAPVYELDEWERLLTKAPYNMKVLGKPLKDSDATRDAILAGLESLLAGANPDDELVWIFLGHGSIFKGTEQALIAYPEGKGLRKAAILYSDVLARLKKFEPPRGTDLTFILDTCFAKGFGGGEMIPLFIPPTPELLESRYDDRDDRDDRDGRIHRFSDLAYLHAIRGDETGADPVILTAAKEDQAAYQIPVGRLSRLLFSYRATERLKRSHDTFVQLIEETKPLRRDFPQEADVRGSADRINEKIPGEPEMKPARSSNYTASTAEASIRMRILGLGCFIKPKYGPTEFVNRIVFPCDTEGQGDMKHFGFLEVAEEDISSFSGTVPFVEYTRGGVPYRRWTLTEHRILLLNANRSASFSRSDEFERHVPAMPVLSPELKYKLPRDECYSSVPEKDLFSGFIDIASGDASVAQLEKQETFFTREAGGTATGWGPEYTPRSVFVRQPFIGAKAIILIENIDAGSAAQIYIKPWSTIMAGNAREIDITNCTDCGPPETPREHFRIFYNIAVPDDKPDNLALPATVSAPVNACSVVKWP